MRAFALLLVLAACDGSEPRARAVRVASPDQLIGGPKALGEVGDWLLENDRVRVIIHDRGDGRGSLPFGGTIIDADLQRTGTSGGADGQPPGPRGNDQLGEIAPAMISTVLRPTQIVIERDGSDGGPAVLAVHGVGADFLQAMGLLMAGLLFPDSLEITQRYTLNPGTAYVEIETEIHNPSTGAHAIPFLDPQQLLDSGLAIPNLAELQLSVPFGHMLGLGALQQVFLPGRTGFNSLYALRDAYTEATGFPAFPGLVADFIATRGDGVSYGLSVPDEESNYPSAFADAYAPQQVTPTSVLIGYNYSSVAGVFSANPPTVIPAGGSFRYTTYFHIGRGDVASISDQIFALRGTTTGKWRGRVVDALSDAPVSVSLVIRDPNGRFVSEVSSDEAGGFSVDLPPGDYQATMIDRLRPPRDFAFTVRARETTSVTLQVDAPAVLALAIADETGRPVPAKATLVGQYDAANAGRDPSTFLFSFELGEARRPTTLDPTRNEFVEVALATANGALRADVRPGTYTLVISSGPEYELVELPIELRTGQTFAQSIQLTRAFATPGWISADVHLHSVGSVDSPLSLPDRVSLAAAEGLDVAIATEHNRIVDYGPAIDATGLTDRLTGVVGVELTTLEAGHFNAYPLAYDASSVRGGDISWLGKTPTQVFETLRARGVDPARTVVQVNHPRLSVLGYFNNYLVDGETATPTPAAGLRAVFAPYGDEFALEEFSYDFDALELLTGKYFDSLRSGRAPDPLPPGPYPDPQPQAGEIIRDQNGDQVFPGTVDTWFAMLNRGLRPTGVGASDSHTAFEEPGFPRTYVWVGEDRDEVGAFSELDLAEAIRNHRAQVSTGPLIDMTVAGQGLGADVTADENDEVEVRIRIRWPRWQPVRTLTLWANGNAIETFDLTGQDGAYDAAFVIHAPADQWLVAEVTGDANLFPVITPFEYESPEFGELIDALASTFDLSALDPYGAIAPSITRFVTPYAITNPVWIDIDGDGFDPPEAPLARRQRPVVPAATDVREAFARLPDLAQGAR